MSLCALFWRAPGPHQLFGSRHLQPVWVSYRYWCLQYWPDPLRLLTRLGTVHQGCYQHPLQGVQPRVIYRNLVGCPGSFTVAAETVKTQTDSSFFWRGCEIWLQREMFFLCSVHLLVRLFFVSDWNLEWSFVRCRLMFCANTRPFPRPFKWCKRKFQKSRQTWGAGS